MLVEVTERFIEEAHWLAATPYLPVVAALRVLAQEIDAQANASLIGEYGKTYRYAMSLKPDEAPDVDPLEALLNGSVS